MPKDVILAFLPESDLSKAYGDQVTIAWSTNNVKGPYQVIFSNLMEEDIARIDATESFVTISLNDDKFKHEPQVMVRIVAKDKPGAGSKNYIVKRLQKDDRSKIDSLMAQLDPYEGLHSCPDSSRKSHSDGTRLSVGVRWGWSSGRKNDRFANHRRLGEDYWSS